jgi:hypothetical protein
LRQRIALHGRPPDVHSATAPSAKPEHREIPFMQHLTHARPAKPGHDHSDEEGETTPLPVEPDEGLPVAPDEEGGAIPPS